MQKNNNSHHGYCQIWYDCLACQADLFVAWMLAWWIHSVQASWRILCCGTTMAICCQWGSEMLSTGAFGMLVCWKRLNFDSLWYICNLQSLLKTFGIFFSPYSPPKNLPRQFATNLRLCKKAWVCLDISSCKRILHSWLGRPSMAVSCHSWLDIITWETKALAFVWCSAGRCCSHWQFKVFKV